MADFLCFYSNFHYLVLETTGHLTVFCAVYVLCVLDCFFVLKLNSFAGCVFICKNLQESAKKCKKNEEKGKDRLPITFKI